jgi:hypothetical protein
MMLLYMPDIIQSILFSKPKYTRKSALQWCKDHGYKSYTSRETTNKIRIRQIPPKKGAKYKTKKITPDIYFIIEYI